MSGSNKQTTTQSTSSQTSPWAPQAGALTSAFDNAQNAYKTASGVTAPSDFVAQFSPDQLATFKSMLGYGNTNGVSAANAATGNTLADAGTNGATGALSGLLGYSPTDPTAQNISDATQYANNPAISGMVQAAMRDATQTAHDVVLPGMESNAAATGNINSSRTGVAEGLVQRALGQQAGDISSNLRGSAYNEGLNLASNNNQFNISSLLGALGSAGGLGGSLASSGVAARSGSVGDAVNSYGIANAGGEGGQAATQARLDNSLAKYQSGVTAPFTPLDQLMQIIGSNNWGSNSSGTSTGTQTSTPSIFSTIGSLMGAGGSLLGSKPGAFGGGSGMLGLFA